MRDAGLALSLLTVVPTPARMPSDGSTPQSAGWFPAVGLLVGAVGYGLAKAFEAWPHRGEQGLLIAALLVVIWALTTRMLHFDGLGDVADGFWGSHDRVRRLEIMCDSHMGAFGATAIALTALVEVAAIAAIITTPHQLPLLLVPALARFSATAGCWLGSPARAGGLGRSVMARPTLLGALPAIAVLAAVVASLWLGFGVTGIALFALGVLTAMAVPHLLAGRFGGVTGDVLGASVLLTETLLFVAFAIAG
jgi:adenosylcobinamide-GDP ribazoletransferase